MNRILHLQGLKVSLLIGMYTTHTRMGGVFANRAGHFIFLKGKCLFLYGWILHLLGWEVSLSLGLDTIFIKKGRALAITAGHYIS